MSGSQFVIQQQSEPSPGDVELLRIEAGRLYLLGQPVANETQRVAALHVILGYHSACARLLERSN